MSCELNEQQISTLKAIEHDLMHGEEIYNWLIKDL